MKFSINSNDLIASLNILDKAQKKGVATAISSIKFTINGDNTLHLATNDGDMEVSTTINVFDVETGSFCVNSEQFSKMIRGVANQNITLTCDEKNYAIVIKYNSGKFKMVGNDAEHYMSINFTEERNHGYQLDSSALEAALNKAKVCVSDKDVLRPVMGGIHFDFENNGWSVVGTDGHGLMYCHKAFEGDADTKEMNMPLKAANILSSILSQDKSNPIFYINENSAEIECGAYIIKTRLLEGRFPNYEAVIPQDNDILINFNRKNLISALKRVVGFTDTTSNLVKIIGVPDKCYYLASENIEMSLSAKEMVETNKPEQDFKIGFNGINLLNILNTFEDEEVCIMAKAANKPILIKSNEGIHTECILMPLQIID